MMPSGPRTWQNPVVVLDLLQPADEFGTMGTQAGKDVLDVVDGEQDAADTQRVRRCVRLGADGRRRVEPHQLEPAVAVRGPHHRDVEPDLVESGDAGRPLTINGRLALEHGRGVDPQHAAAAVAEVGAVDVQRDRGVGTGVDHLVDVAGRGEAVHRAGGVGRVAENGEVVALVAVHGLLLGTLQHAEHAPCAVVVDRRPLTGPPHDGLDRERGFGVQEDPGRRSRLAGAFRAREDVRSGQVGPQRSGDRLGRGSSFHRGVEAGADRDDQLVEAGAGERRGCHAPRVGPRER